MSTRSGTANGRHGFLIVDKPAGWTSHDVVGRLRRLLGERRVGHAGTLDPAATGVLVVAVGRATRFLEYLEGAAKTYLAEVTFGVETDSYDADGSLTAQREIGDLDRDRIAAALSSFLGPQRQVPPMHSAVKVGGRRLYEAARRGEVVERPAREVEFQALALLDWQAPVATVWIDCSKGTYVRSLAFDLGRAVGVGAHLSDLVRVRSGPFTLCQAWTLTELTALVEESGDDFGRLWPDVAVHPDAALEECPVVVADEGGARVLTTGHSWRPSGADADESAGVVDGTRARAYDAEGELLGVVEWRGDRVGWHPRKMVG